MLVDARRARALASPHWLSAFVAPPKNSAGQNQEEDVAGAEQNPIEIHVIKSTESTRP